jgi:CRISPR-associated protein Csx3
MSTVLEKCGINLILSRHTNPEGISYQLLEIEMTRPDRLAYPRDLPGVEMPASLDLTTGVIVSGRAPIWLYGHIMHLLHPTPWVACFDPRMDAGVVVASHSPEARVGQVIPVGKKDSRELAPAVLIVGPPNSGKSCLARGLFDALTADGIDVYLQRAQWDGEGNYTSELPPDADPDVFRRANKGEATDEFFPYQAEAVLHLRRTKSLVLVDLGGKVDPNKQPVLEACSHYIIVSSDAGEVDGWHRFCRDRANLSCVAEVLTTLEETEEVLRESGLLRMRSGPWTREETARVPEALLHEMLSLPVDQGAPVDR